MSSAGGGSGIGGGNAPTVLPPEASGATQAADSAVAAEEAADLSPEQLASLERARIARVGEQSSFEIRQELGVAGPESTTAGITDLDQELADLVFSPNNVANPYNANTTPTIFKALQGTDFFNNAVAGLTGYLNNPTSGNQQAFIQQFNSGIQQLGDSLQDLYNYDPDAASTRPTGANVMEVLFLVFRESIQEVNEDKKYFLLKLQEFNRMGEVLSDYLSELVEHSRQLGADAAGQKYPEMVLTAEPVQIRKFDLSALHKTNPNDPGTLKEFETGPAKPLNREGLNDTIKEVESMQETLRNKRQMASTAFQNFDQKSNQLYNLLSSVLKSFNEMRSGTVRNML